MIRDFLAFDGDDDLECDLCIAGAGAAGIAMALSFLGHPTRIVLLESGGLDLEPDTQALYEGRNVGRDYFDLSTARLRFLGGSTNHWGGMCSRLDPIDFEPRPWVEHSGWPISFADLEPFYPQAHALLELGPYDYDPASAPPDGLSWLDVAPEHLKAKVWRYSTPPLNFNQRFRRDLEQAVNIDLLLHANLVDIETSAQADRVQAFVIKSLSGRTARVRARAYVLAMGGLENPRVLLNANHVVPQGLGNQNDLVGRFFMEHLGAVTGAVVKLEGEWPASYVDQFEEEHQTRIALHPSREAQARERILNSMAMFGEVSLKRWQSEGYGAVFDLKEALLDGRMPDDLGNSLWQIITDLDGVVGGMVEKVDPTTYITVEAEQAPNPDSRVMLGDERDALGLRRSVLDWRLSAIDKRSVRVLTELLARELGRLGAGRVRLEEWLIADDHSWPEELVGAFHHMGTTRMADSPKDGVVDRYCRIFGIDNCWIAGSSVFSTGGCANPTLNLVALALRLAGHLRDRMA